MAADMNVDAVDEDGDGDVHMIINMMGKWMGMWV